MFTAFHDAKTWGKLKDFRIGIVKVCPTTGSNPILPSNTCVDGFANGHVRMVVGFARIRLACESMRIANPHQKCTRTVPTPRRKRLWWAIRTISRRLGNHCRIRANPLGLRIHANCESASQSNTHNQGLYLQNSPEN